MTGDFSSITARLREIYGPFQESRGISTTTALKLLDEAVEGRRYTREAINHRCPYCTSKQVEGKINCPNCGGPY